MVSSPHMSLPAPTRSLVKDDVDLRHPMPDLQSLQGAYVGNIERLEEHAERMSEPGSDLGEEIRKLHTELKQSDSRRSSLRSIQTFEEPPTRHFSTRSRNLSNSSQPNSIVDLNGTARWGGYSPGGYVTSPVGSLRSGSWSNPSTSIQRQRSESKASRLGQVVHPHDVEDAAERMAAYPGSLQSAVQAAHQRDSPPSPEQRKVSSFTRIYDEIANDLPEDLRNSVILGQTPDHAEERQPNYHDLPDRPPTAASADTTHQARTLWMDFDGVHCPDTVIEEEPTPSQGSHSRQHSGQHNRQHSRQSSNMSFMMRSSPDLPVMGAPPPDENMVFYPAPVPRMLNLPKRLSQLPATNVQAKRRTQLLESMQQDNRKSAPLLGEMLDNNQKSRQSLMALPPQLRASAYFDQVAETQEFAVKGESAEDTLESILDASAHAPVFAFTDHLFAGQVGSEVYGPEHKRKSSIMPEVPPTLAETKRRSSFNMLDTKRKSSGDPLNKLKKRNSSADMNLLVVRASENRMSLGDELDERDEEPRGPLPDQDTTPGRQSFEDDDDRQLDDVDEEEALEPEEEEQEEMHFGAPTTLLAELQIRKAKQKTRTMNYATLLEQGMINTRRTLLEMDDVAEKQKQRRIRRKVNLAWEAQAQEEDDSDDDVPLGVLFKQGGGQQRRETIRPGVGLMAQRELEDNEPLSRRRTRLHGIDPRDQSSSKRGTHYLGASSSQLNLAVPTTTTPDLESGEEGETLGERMRRLKDKQMISNALGDDHRKSTVSGDFAAEMFSKLGFADSDEKPQPSTPPVAEEEETLGQRRARLQAEAAARGDPAPRTRPGLRSSTSFADLLSANPINTTHEARKVSNEMLVSHLPQGSLLHQNEIAEERRKAQRLTQTMRASSYGMDPLLRNVVERRNDDGNQPLATKIQAYKNAMAGGNVPPNIMYAPQQQQQQQSGMGGARLSQPNMMMQNPQMMGQQMQMAGYPQSQHPGMMGVPVQMQMGAGMQMNGMGMGMPMGMMGMGMGIGPNGMPMMMPPMDPRQRDQIDRWMQGIRH